MGRIQNTIAIPIYRVLPYPVILHTCMYNVYVYAHVLPQLSWSQALRVSTLSSEANGSFPLVFVTRQGKAVDSWTIPFRPPDFSIDFDRVNRTLCQQDTSADVDDVLAYIDVFTSFSENVTFSIVFEPVGNYTFRNDTWYSIVVGASTPQVHFFEFPDGVDTVTVEAEASNKRCAILSVQNVTVSIHIMFLSVLLVHVYACIS
jgi:hypothetical protein